MRTARRLLAVVVLVASFAAVRAPLPASAATAASDTAVIVFAATGPTCLFASADDSGDLCGFTLTSTGCTSPGADGFGEIACTTVGTIDEPDGDNVAVSFTITGADAGFGIVVFATAVTGSAFDDGSSWVLAGQNSGLGCFIGCSLPSEVTLTW